MTIPHGSIQEHAMTKAELEALRRQLLDLGQRLKGNVSSLEKEALRDTGGAVSGNLSNTPMHLADLGSDTFEQEVSVNLLQNEEQQLEQISAALQRMEQGTYGRCDSCGQEIGMERLKALPYTSLCIRCASETLNPASPGNL